MSYLPSYPIFLLQIIYKLLSITIDRHEEKKRNQ